MAKVADKIFAFLGSALKDGERPSVGLKCGRNRDEADEWLDRFPGDAHVMAYIGRSGWNTLDAGGLISDEEIKEAIDASYETVVGKLPTSKRPDC